VVSGRRERVRKFPARGSKGLNSVTNDSYILKKMYIQKLRLLPNNLEGIKQEDETPGKEEVFTFTY